MFNIKKYLLQFIKHPLMIGSGIIFFGSLFTNILNFLFNLFMVRNLSEIDYGILASLVSLISLATLPAGAIVPTIVHFGATYFAKGQIHLVRGLFFKITKLLFLFGITILIVSVVFTNNIKGFFRIEDDMLIILTNISIFFGIMQVINVALIQAKLAFSFLTLTNILGSILKLSLGVLLVSLGFSIKGGLSAYFFSAFIPYIICFIPLRFVFEKGVASSKLPIRDLISYAAPSAITLFGLASFITTDIILVKHFFNPVDAGVYAALSLVGKVIFYFSAPITTVMFPLIVQKFSQDKAFHEIFKLALFLVFLPSIILTICYFFFPQFIVKVFTNKETVLALAPSYLWLLGIFITIYSVLVVVTNFFLAIKKTKIFTPVIACAGLQALGIWFFHTSFFEVILISIGVAGLLLISLLLYYWKLYGQRAKI